MANVLAVIVNGTDQPWRGTETVPEVLTFEEMYNLKLEPVPSICPMCPTQKSFPRLEKTWENILSGKQTKNKKQQMNAKNIFLFFIDLKRLFISLFQLNYYLNTFKYKKTDAKYIKKVVLKFET